MKKNRPQEHIINWLVPKFFLLALVGFVLVFGQSYVSPDKSLVFTAQTFQLDFDQFSPAFAAFEDEYLYENMDSVPAVALRSGEATTSFEKLAAKDKVETKVRVRNGQTLASQKKANPVFQNLLNHFDGEKAVSEIKTLRTTLAQIVKKEEIEYKKELSDGGELAFGPLAANINPRPQVVSQEPRVNDPIISKSLLKKALEEQEMSAQAKELEAAPDVTNYKVLGGIQLKQGLAFIGSMEVSWVVGDYELQRGSINTPDATYEIEVSKLVGDVIISLYDSNDELIGEGLLDLTQFKPNQEEIVSNIQVLPIDWDVAGQIVHADSLGTGVRKPVEGVEVALYSFNDATQSDSSGEFSFFNWKKTNSRTLAIASKEGFFDSIFTLDSKTEANVLLFENKYMVSFFKYLENLGIYEVEDKGTVYGKIQGIENAEGYVARLEKSTPLYFMTAGFATLDQKATSTNGLFSFVGLQDGDYELVIERDGEILDERLVIVEQGKVSPVIVDLSKVSKHLEFFDPMDSNNPINEVELSFFDGSSKRNLDSENQIRQTLHRGHDLSLMEVKGRSEVSRTLLSRHKGLQKIPLINDKVLIELARSNDLYTEKGLVFGFVESEEPFQVFMAEEDPGKILYFDENGRLLENEETRPARGFILGDFGEGLRSVIVERKSDGMILGTDLIYSNHESISITNLEIHPAP